MNRGRRQQLFLWAYGVCFLAAILLTVVAARTGTLHVDVVVGRRIQGVQAPGLLATVRAFNWAGHAAPLITAGALLVVALIVSRRVPEAVLMLSAVTAHGLTWTLKQLAASPRPTADVLLLRDHASGYGFPSGHALSATVYCGVAVFIAWNMVESARARWGVAICAGCIVLGVGFSRVYVGVHWPTDVLGGYIWGTLTVSLLCVAFCKVQGCGRHSRSAWHQTAGMS